MKTYKGEGARRHLKTLATISTNKRIFLVAWQLAHVSHIQRASLDELFEPLLFISQRRNFSCQSLSLAQRPLNLQQTTAPVNERKVSRVKYSALESPQDAQL